MELLAVESTTMLKKHVVGVKETITVKIVQVFFSGAKTRANQFRLSVCRLIIGTGLGRDYLSSAIKLIL